MRLSALVAWFETNTGKCLLQLEQEQVRRWVSKTQPTTIVQLGGLPEMFYQVAHPKGHYYFLSNYIDEISTSGINLIADGEELPFLPNSIDLVLLTHVLEYAEHPTMVLKEIFDILAPNGKLLLFCFNPWSLWGAHKLFADKYTFPWMGKFISPARLHQWLMSLGYTTVKDKTLGYRFASNTRRITRLTYFFEALGQIVVPMMGAVSVFLVEKRVYAAVNQRRYQWQQQRALSSGIIQPTTRSKSD